MNRSLLIEQLMRHEGVKLRPYRCTAGKLTIGVGRNLEDVGISRAEAEELLQHDIDRILREARHLPVYEDLDHIRQNVIMNMLFNLGLSRLLKFKRMFEALEKGSYTLAAAEMLDSRWAEQVGDRAKELAEMMRTGKVAQ